MRARRGRLFLTLWFVVFGLLGSSAVSLAQQNGSLPDTPQPQAAADPVSPPASQEQRGWNQNHILWVIPNYRSDELTDTFRPLTRRGSSWWR